MTTDKADSDRNVRILVVDDDPEGLETTGGILERHGYKVKTADSGQAALALLDTADFDLVVTDCRMDPVDGWAVLRQVKRQDPGTPVIMLAGSGEVATAKAALRETADDFLIKPVNAAMLLPRIDICLARQTMQKRAQVAEATLAITNRAIESLQVGLVICQALAPDYRVVFVNRQFEKLTGYAGDDIIGRSMNILQGSGTDPETVRAIGRALQTGGFYSGDILNFRSDGTPFWNSLTLSPVFDDQGVVEHFVATLMDITARKREEEDRRNSETLYRGLFENTSDALVVYDTASGRIEDANPAALNLFGYRLPELQGQPVDVLEAAGTGHTAIWAASRKDLMDKPIRFLSKKDGTVFAGDVARGLFVSRGREKGIQTIKDITPRLTMETRLKESENRFRQLSENIDEVFWLTNHDLTETLYISPSYEQLWRRPCEELYLEPESRLKRIHPGDRMNLIYNLQAVPRAAYEMTYRLTFTAGADRWVRERGFPIRNDAGEIYRFAVVFSNITEEKQLREEMEAHLQQVVHTDRLAGIGEMVAGVAHEINNPNSFITYNIPLLAETWQAFEPIVAEYARQHPGKTIGHLAIDEMLQDMREIIDAIGTGSERINRIVSNLKDFARLDESANFQSVCLNTAVERAMTIVGAQLRRSADVVDLSTADQMPPLQGHPQKIEQVIVNLLVNAAHAILHKKGGRIAIRTRYLERIGAVLLEVEDNGCGIEPDHLKRLFEPFFTTRRTEGGTGLGLSVSYGLVKEHRGLIGVLSRPGRGSCFKVFLPLGDQAQLELNPTILCVDDQPAVLKLIRAMLIKTEDRFVKTVSDPAGVIPFLETHPEVDLVISDIMMPGIDGWQLLKMMRTRFPLIGVILFSSHIDVLDQNLAPELEPDALLAKPFERADLVQAIHSVGRMKL